ncbi:skin secretory protein xP2-like [Rhagoletis pomonella]|uniref:skin secretory protein xP2-like n=1 Tax=Rhagoletis pomonella TaxID=28610 RepID=UPI001780FF50|nr:skin secretory protein xP2-like [Rhagoletis pomonella]
MAFQFATIAVMSFALFSTLASADVSSLRYNGLGRLTTRLQRQEASPTPYPASGYQPREPFDIPSPDKQQFFPQQPQSPAQPQFQAEPQPEVSGFDLESTPSLGSNGDHIDAPNALYDAPAQFRQTQASRQRLAFSRQQFSATSPQQSRLPQSFRQTLQATEPQRFYSAPSDNSEAFTRQRQQFATAQQNFPQAPQRLYDAPVEDEPQAERLTSAVKSERLTASQPEEQREEREDEAEVATDIEVTEVKTTTPQAAAPTPNTSVFYYPANAIGFVHPLTAAYYQPSAFIAPAAQPAVATAAAPSNGDRPAPATAASPVRAAKPARVTALASQVSVPAVAPVAAPQYFAASPYLQQYAFAAPAQLQAW